TALAARRATLLSRHVGGRCRLIQEDQVTAIPTLLLAGPLSSCLTYVCARLLAGVQGFF
ncbi:hypothetical protein SAMN05216379_1611, partial [Nitrosomonas eutropha]